MVCSRWKRPALVLKVTYSSRSKYRSRSRPRQSIFELDLDVTLEHCCSMLGDPVQNTAQVIVLTKIFKVTYFSRSRIRSIWPIIELDLDHTLKYFPIRFGYAGVNIQIIVLTKVWRTDGLTDWQSVIQVLPFSRKSWIGSKKPDGNRWHWRTP